jgi:hypothetical protein
VGIVFITRKEGNHPSYIYDFSRHSYAYSEVRCLLSPEIILIPLVCVRVVLPRPDPAFPFRCPHCGWERFPPQHAGSLGTHVQLPGFFNIPRRCPPD